MMLIVNMAILEGILELRIDIDDFLQGSMSITPENCRY